MSVASCMLTEDQLLCCICLDVFTAPVTIPCGHNFCKSCITQHWDVNGFPCKCPLCKRQFAARPELPVNTFISGLADDFRQLAGKRGASGSQLQVAKAGEIPCDICIGTKLKAVKSCLTCFASYCGVHMDPHQTSDRLRTHVLTDPVGSMEGRVCPTHKKPLELFCRHDQTFVCSHCTVSEHSGHKIVSLKDEYEARKGELERAEADIQLMVGEREQKSQRIELLKKHSREDAEREIANGVRIFTMVMQKAERDLNGLIEKIEEQQKRVEQEADGFLGELEGEITTLKARTAEVQQLTHTQDHLHVLKNFACVKVSAPTKNWSGISVHVPSYEGKVVKAVAELEETLSQEKEQLLRREGLRRVQHYAVDVVLEPATAHPWLVLSEDGKQVQCGDVRRDLPDNLERFSLYTNVLAQQSFSSGRFYYEVRVTGKSDWTLGVATSSVNRKGIVPMSPANGYWAVSLRNGNEFLTLACPVISLALHSRPQRVGVFVSYEEGLVSFHDVDEAVCLYCFSNCGFTEELYPFFNPGLHHGDANTAPLMITAVNRNK